MIELDVQEAVLNDSIDDSTDYSEVLKEIIHYTESSSYELLESLTYHLAQNLIEKFSLTSVLLKIHKPLATKGLSKVFAEYYQKA